MDAADVLVVSLTSDHGEFEFMISSLREEIYLGLWDSTNEVLVQQFKSNQLLKLHEWTRIEICHIEEGGNYFVTLSVGEQELGRGACQLGRNLSNVKISSGS